MAKYISNRQQNLKIGIVSYTEDKTVLEVTGKVGIGTTNATSKLHVVGDAIVTGVVTATSGFVGNLTGTATSTTNIPNLTGAITSVNTTTSLGSFTSLQLATALTDETGSGSAVFATSPTLVTPVLGAASATSIVVSSGSTFTNGPILVGTATSTGTASQPLQVTGGAYVSGNLGIGTTNATSKLHVVGDVLVSGVVTATTYYGSGANLTGISASGGVAISTNTENQAQYLTYAIGTGSTTGLGVSTTGLTFNPSTGNMVVSGTVTANSDEKLKTNIQTIPNALEKVLNLRGVEFDRKSDGVHSIGFIAQEVEKVVPDLVFGDDPKSVAYQNFVAILVEAIKELKSEVDTLKNIIK